MSKKENTLIVKGVDNELILKEYENTEWFPVMVLLNEVHFVRLES